MHCSLKRSQFHIIPSKIGKQAGTFHFTKQYNKHSDITHKPHAADIPTKAARSTRPEENEWFESSFRAQPNPRPWIHRSS